jgi:hypothetical protein
MVHNNKRALPLRIQALNGITALKTALEMLESMCSQLEQSERHLRSITDQARALGTRLAIAKLL